ncbi:lipid kinase [Aliidiomarina maris]|uniref:Diacylglycerol kinase n=1 Tax=Aliidiomarina maris TaxID=531312 RepID=A0A327WR40_9GAMM|nr:lipid kinase [Aliidiomarina maris]RAJ94861.1 YegS/Rv2252/BmrU family lipid kinase [Aliidiomarina maris]RUO20536.1 diacylglycerol kinase [Aliidiomarina maris]
MQQALLIVNPNSRNGASDELEHALDVLQSGGMNVQVCESKSASHMAECIADFDQQDGVVIIAGGDGTISSALAAAYEHQRTLAILPMGTANDFARSIGVPDDLEQAAQVIIAGQRQRINLAQVNQHYFVNVAHIGLGVDVTHELTPESKKIFGVFAYLAASMQAIKRNRHFKVQIKSAKWQRSLRGIHLAIGNGRYYGGGNIVDEHSTLQDGKLNLFCLQPQPWWRLLLLGGHFRQGKLRHAERVVCHAASTFTISTSKPKQIEADGEVKTKTPAEFKVIPEALEVIVGDMPQPEAQENSTHASK